MNLEDKHMIRLYTMLAKTKNEDNVAALRWAIFTLEQLGGQAKKEGLHEPSILQGGQHKAEDTP